MNNNNIFNDPCGSGTLRKDNYLSEFSTPCERRKALHNLGISWDLEDIQCYMKSQILYPDEEDLTLDKNKCHLEIKFKDKVYCPCNFSGKGRVYLRKNICTYIDNGCKVVKNVLT
jgi:hypothetical protein